MSGRRRDLTWRWRCCLCPTAFGFEATEPAAVDAFERHYQRRHRTTDSTTT